MNTREHAAMKMRGNPDISYLGHTVGQMIWSFMKKQKIDGLILAIVQAPYIPRAAGYGYSDSQRRRPGRFWPDSSAGKPRPYIYSLEPSRREGSTCRIRLAVLPSPGTMTTVSIFWKASSLRQKQNHAWNQP